jgi:two-component system response regulator VicR
MGQEEVVVDAFDLGASDFMVKPFSPNELILRIKRLINK